MQQRKRQFYAFVYVMLVSVVSSSVPSSFSGVLKTLWRAEILKAGNKKIPERDKRGRVGGLEGLSHRQNGMRHLVLWKTVGVGAKGPWVRLTSAIQVYEE